MTSILILATAIPALAYWLWQTARSKPQPPTGPRRLNAPIMTSGAVERILEESRLDDGVDPLSVPLFVPTWRQS